MPESPDTLEPKPVAVMPRDEALAVLEAAVDRAGRGRVDTAEVRAALKSLLPISRDRAFLDWFWEAAAGDDAIGRGQNVTAALNGIRRQLR